MAFSSSSSSVSATINVTPLIDVLLVLLIIFMVITPLTPRGLESLLPAASIPASKPAPDPLIVEVIAAETHGGPLGYRVAGKLVDLRTLRAMLQAARSVSADPAVMIAGDPRLDYKAVVDVVSAAQQAGFPAISLLPRRKS